MPQSAVISNYDSVRPINEVINPLFPHYDKASSDKKAVDNGLNDTMRKQFNGQLEIKEEAIETLDFDCLCYSPPLNAEPHSLVNNDSFSPLSDFKTEPVTDFDSQNKINCDLQNIKYFYSNNNIITNNQHQNYINFLSNNSHEYSQAMSNSDHCNSSIQSQYVDSSCDNNKAIVIEKTLGLLNNNANYNTEIFHPLQTNTSTIMICEWINCRSQFYSQDDLVC